MIVYSRAKFRKIIQRLLLRDGRFTSCDVKLVQVINDISGIVLTRVYVRLTGRYVEEDDIGKIFETEQTPLDLCRILKVDDSQRPIFKTDVYFDLMLKCFVGGKRDWVEIDNLYRAKERYYQWRMRGEYVKILYQDTPANPTPDHTQESQVKDSDRISVDLDQADLVQTHQDSQKLTEASTSSKNLVRCRS